MLDFSSNFLSKIIILHFLSNGLRLRNKKLQFFNSFHSDGAFELQRLHRPLFFIFCVQSFQKFNCLSCEEFFRPFARDVTSSPFLLAQVKAFRASQFWLTNLFRVYESICFLKFLAMSVCVSHRSPVLNLGTKAPQSFLKFRAVVVVAQAVERPHSVQVGWVRMP